MTGDPIFDFFWLCFTAPIRVAVYCVRLALRAFLFPFKVALVGLAGIVGMKLLKR